MKLFNYYKTLTYNQRFNQQVCYFSSKIAVKIPNRILEKLDNNEIKPRHHPGILKSGCIVLPIQFRNSLMRCIGDFPIKDIIKSGEEISRYIKARHAPPEEQHVRKKVNEIEVELELVLPATPVSPMSEDAIIQYKKKRQKRIQKILKQRLMAWKVLTFNQYDALSYAFGRSAQEYAVLRKIFFEINQRDPHFKPNSYFDFGSGVGTGMWAASHFWKHSIFEYFNVDLSREMNDLSELILRGGSDNQEMSLKNVFYRQFLPATEVEYNIVVSAFSLFELPNNKARKEILLNLWKKCNGYMIIIEEGTRHGFNLIIEARDFLLNTCNNEEGKNGYIFSPCPHNSECPRMAQEDNKTPCNFEIKYEPITVPSSSSKHLYSYVVLKKGLQKEDDDSEKWPRIIRPTLVKSKHAICRMCSDEGKLQEIIFTASKHGKLTYRCAKSSRWGDRLPIKIKGKMEIETKAKTIVNKINTQKNS